MLFTKYLNSAITSISLTLNNSVFNSLSKLPKTNEYYAKNSKKNFVFTESSSIAGVPSTKPSTHTEPNNVFNYASVGTITNTYDLHALKYSILIGFRDLINRSFSFGFLYIRGFVVILFIDACLTDDEPLGEPIEGSLVQTGILVTFSFAGIAENLIVSRYGSYTGRDKRVGMSGYKTFGMIEGFYVLNYGVVSAIVIVPFYFETNYNLSFVYSGGHGYSRVFFFKFLSIYSIVLILANLLQISVRWLNGKKGLILIILINAFLAYLLYTHFIITFLGYFTDPTGYQKVRPIDYIQLSHEPARGGGGPAKKDHFTYHNVKTVLGFKNDGPFAASFLLFQTFMFVCIFLTFIGGVSLCRRVYSMKEIPQTFTTYCVSSLRQFLYLFLLLYLFVFLSYLSNYGRFPMELAFTINTIPGSYNFLQIMLDYPTFLLSIFR